MDRMTRRIAYIALTFFVAMGWLRGFFIYLPLSSQLVEWGLLLLLFLLGVFFRNARLPFKLPLFYLLMQLLFWQLGDWLPGDLLLQSGARLVLITAALLLLERGRAVRLCCPGKIEQRLEGAMRLPGFLGRLRWNRLSLIGALALYLGMSLMIYLSRGSAGNFLSATRLGSGILNDLTMLMYYFVGPLLLIEPRIDDDSARLLLVLFYAFPFYGGIGIGILSILYAYLTVRSLQETRGILAAIILTLGISLGNLLPLGSLLPF